MEVVGQLGAEFVYPFVAGVLVVLLYQRVLECV